MQQQQPRPQYPQFKKPSLQQWQPQPDYVQPQTHYPPQQYHMLPQYQPPPHKKKLPKWPWLILVIIVLLLFAGIIVSFTVRSGRNTTATNVQATHPPTQQQGTSQPTTLSTSTSHPTPVPTVQPSEVPAITHGNPQLEGPISDFTGKYGQPFQNGLSSDSFWADKAHTIRVDVTPQGTIVHEILVSGTSNWSATQTKTFCEQFLPPGSSPFNTTGNVTDYQSSIGDITMQLGPGSCLLTTH